MSLLEHLLVKCVPSIQMYSKYIWPHDVVIVSFYNPVKLGPLTWKSMGSDSLLGPAPKVKNKCFLKNKSWVHKFAFI